MKELWHISAFRQTYPVYYLATKSEIATGLSKHFTRLSINMKELYVNNIINTLCALSLLCALLGNALLPYSSLPLQRTIWLPMLIIGMASFSRDLPTSKRRGHHSIGILYSHYGPSPLTFIGIPFLLPTQHGFSHADCSCVAQRHHSQVDIF